ncbi:hypothetical protein Nos7524_5649 (plasmid) [Nostoc sp. PCC 7524]|uniref:MarR family transcriptional regulator n=1 Tax=Nostoc sp. (strain ATCC 29411 / PCC 7524) TaxID=28072 RepID=UPI00029F3673|nr:MarR family transcriptional regulator [Nostoc sp. PCC 7524]AFY51339.1 hypothetical protein Nos7524_5649 [Nostoc sp. PCC 7524]
MKIDGKFYPLQNSEWVKICKSLTKSQISILYYVRSLDPYGNGMKIRASKIAEDLGITKRAVNAAIAVLEEKGYINLEDIDYSVKVSAGGCLCLEKLGAEETSEPIFDCDTTPTVTQVGTEFPTQEQNFPLEKKNSHLGTEFPDREQNFPTENRISHQEPEVPTEQEPQDSKINKTYSEFINTLSEEERANFLEFCEEKTKNLSKPVNDIEAWLAHTNKAGKNRWEVYYEKFVAATQKAQEPEYRSGRGREMMQKFHEELEEQRRQAMRMCGNTV